jgi:hypothetical protein
MMIPEPFRHTVPFQSQPSGHTAGGPASSSGQVSPEAVSGAALEVVGDAPQATTATTTDTPSKPMHHRIMFPPSNLAGEHPAKTFTQGGSAALLALPSSIPRANVSFSHPALQAARGPAASDRGWRFYATFAVAHEASELKRIPLQLFLLKGSTNPLAYGRSSNV